MKAPQSAPSVEEFIATLPEPRRSQIQEIFDFMRAIAPEKEVWIIKNMIGFGRYTYRSKSGCSGEWFDLGIGSNKSSISIYAIGHDEHGMIAEQYRDKLPKADIGKSCIRFKNFSDLDHQVLNELLRKSLACPSFADHF